MAFRSKPAHGVLDEPDMLAERHGIMRFNMVDNILDLGYIKSLLPRFARPEPYTLFYKTEANLRREQLQAIATAGIRRLQPGSRIWTMLSSSWSTRARPVRSTSGC